MNRAALRQAVRDRLGVPDDDGLLTDSSIDGDVRAALRAIEVDRDWPWLEQQVTFVTVKGTGSYPVATFAPAGDWAHSLSARLVEDQGDYLLRSEPQDIDQQFPLNTTGRPEMWTVDVELFVVRPIPDGVYNVVHRYQRTESDLAQDTDQPVMPPRFHQAIVEYATALAARRAHQSDRAAEAMQEYGAWRARMVDDRHRVATPPRVRVRDWF